MINQINENEGTLVIANGSELKNSKTRSNYHNGGNTLRVYGYSGKTPTYIPKTLTTNNYAEGAQYLYRWPKTPAAGTKSRYSHYTQYVDPNILKINIIINYSIKNDKVELSLKENGFVIYGDNLINKNDDNLVKRDLGYRDLTANSNDYLKDWSDNRDHSTRNDLEAWFVCNGLEATPRTTTQDVFILPEALGNYGAFTKPEHIIGNPDISNANKDSDNNYCITIRRYSNSYDQVTITGLFPGQDSYVKGTITNEGGTYKLTIPNGQQLIKSSNEGSPNTYFIYTSQETGLVWDPREYTGNNLVLTRSKDGKEWSSDYNAFPAIARQGQEPSDSSPGLYWYRWTTPKDKSVIGNYFVLVLGHVIQEEIGTPPPSQETTVTQVALRFTPDMFKANPTITSGASLAPRRQGQEDAVASPIVNIRATGESVSGNALIVVDSTARNDYSMAEDAPLFDVQDYEFCFATLAGEQVVGVNVVRELDIIPLYIQSSTETLTLHFDNVEALGDNIELYDALTEDSTHITSGSTVNITLYHGDEAGRFFLRRRAQQQEPTKPDGPATGISTTTTPYALHAWSPMQGIAVVNAEQVPQGAHLHIIDMNGRIIYNTPLRPIQTVRGLTSGVYILKVSDSTTCQEVKLLVH